jgi:uncharacterized alpha-E superfamily protein
MLSRIAKGIYDLGRQVERAQHVARVLEVNHKMNLERVSADETDVWTAISESFHCDLDQPTEARLYEELILSTSHPYSVRGCVERARDQGRAMRDHISEEMWLHLNRTHLELADLRFEEILRSGRSEFNARIEVFTDAFYGMADDTMIRGQAWAFLRAGRFLERALMICRILEIKRKTLSLAPESEGAPLDVHQWQALLRSLSGYEPYRRAYDARILPERVLEFVLKRPDFPRSLTCSVLELRSALDLVGESGGSHLRLSGELDRMLEELRSIDTTDVARSGSFEPELRRLDRYCRGLVKSLDLAYLTSLRPVANPITAAPGAELVPQQ